MDKPPPITRRPYLRLAALLLVALAFPPAAGVRAAAPVVDPAQKVESRLLTDTANGERTSCVILLTHQADLSAAYTIKDEDARGWYVYNTLRGHARRSQSRLRAWLHARGVRHRGLWAANAIVVTGDRRLLDALSARDDVHTIESNRPRRWIEDPPAGAVTFAPQTTGAIEWGVANIQAPQVWAMGYTGQGIVIGNQDTGMQWNHPALQSHYRGWNGATADHNYNWHDAIHSGGGVCGTNSPAPCDDGDHGTHTTGIAVGDDGAGNQIGVAPGAQWIGCRNMDQGSGTPATYTECFQFFMAPTDLNGGNPDPTRRPHVINNSWGCPPSEGCAPATLQTVVENAQAAGIFIAVSAGNLGPNCSTVDEPPAIYASSFSTGAYDLTNTLLPFSSRGPVAVDASNRLKPEIVAPGGGIVSSVPVNSYAQKSGTSMAGPHVVGTVALLWSARPQLLRDVATTRTILQNAANPSVVVSPAQTCGGIPNTMIPNDSFGYGRVDALAAVNSVPPPATPTAPAPPAPTATPTGANVLSGRVRYYAGDHAVPGVTVQLHGATEQSAQTNGVGQFTLPAIADGTWTLDPVKSGDLGTGVTALDAVYVLQAMLNLRALDPLQTLACDVTGNGTVSALDAVSILQLTVSLIPRLPVANACGSDWAFVPTPAVVPNQQLIQPHVSAGICQRGAIALAPLVGSASDQNFLGVLFGDCTGNWAPGAGGAMADSAPRPSVRAGRLLRGRGRHLRLPLYVSAARAFQAIEVRLAYDGAQLQAVDARPALAARNAWLAFNSDVPGQLTIALASLSPIKSRNRRVLMVEFEGNGPHAASTLVHVLRSRVDDEPAMSSRDF